MKKNVYFNFIMILFYFSSHLDKPFTLKEFQFHYDLILFQILTHSFYIQPLNFNFIMILFYYQSTQ